MFRNHRHVSHLRAEQVENAEDFVLGVLLLQKFAIFKLCGFNSTLVELVLEASGLVLFLVDTVET